MVREQPECYRCKAAGITREHFPPKCFFPKGAGLQLRTVPSCAEHNNGKSGDDLYVLVQICLNAAKGDNQAKKVFQRSVLGALKRSPAFVTALNEGAEWLEGGARRYRVKTPRFDAFFDGLASAIYFNRYGKQFDPARHSMAHEYPSLVSDDAADRSRSEFARNMVSSFFDKFAALVEHYEADKIDEVIYDNLIIDPLGTSGSITIAHSFYGCFEAVSFLTIKRSPIFLVSPPS